MDYGKLAYVKAEELESYLRKTESEKGKNATLCAAFYPRVALESGYAPVTVSGDDSVGLTVVLKLRASKDVTDLKVRLYAGDMQTAYTTVTAAKGETVSATVLSSVYPGSGQRLRVVASGKGLILDEMSVLACGAGVALSGGQSDYRCDVYDGKVYCAHERDGYLYLSQAGGDGEVSVAHASVFDLAASGQGLNVLACDDLGNLWGVCYDGELNETHRVMLGDGFDSVALGRNPFGQVMAAVKGKKLYFALSDENFDGATDWTQFEDVTASEVYLSKQSDNSVLLYVRDGKLYARLPYCSQGTSDCLHVTLGFTEL